MRALVYDCSAGISGDMNLAALIDLGADRENLERELSKLHVHGEWKLECRRAQQHGIRGTRIDVLTEEEGHSGSSHAHHHRTMADIRTLIETSALSNTVKRTALSIFTLLAEAEARVHGTTPEEVHFHEVGAVDYITKPFVIGALQRKIKAMFAMLEHHKPAKDIYDDGRLFLDFSEQTASLNGKPLTLSPMEYKMLNLFRKNPRQVLTRGQLLEKLWDIDERFVDEHTLTTSISRIRSKIESDGGAPYIKTVYGMGYQWTGGEAK